MNHFIQVDEEGYFHFQGVRVTDSQLSHHLFKHMTKNDKGCFTTTFQNIEALVEAFDEPFVAQQVHRHPDHRFEITLAYGYRAFFDLKSLTLDEWDRFHGVTLEKEIPFVFSRKAQSEFFRLLDSFDDNSITIHKKTFSIPPWLETRTDLEKDSFWNEIYDTETPRWELEQTSAPLTEVWPQLKLSKSRILVPGCGSGNDAAFFAKQGHIVTAVDFSSQALEQAQEKYGYLKNITWLREDAFKLPQKYKESFDVIFEHTLYCAINPSLRNKLIETWEKLLVNGGYLLGVFFVFHKPVGPPYGGSEWELQKRLKKYFRLLYWTRWKNSIKKRQGKELVVFAQKKRSG